VGNWDVIIEIRYFVCGVLLMQKYDPHHYFQIHEPFVLKKEVLKVWTQIGAFALLLTKPRFAKPALSLSHDEMVNEGGRE